MDEDYIKIADTEDAEFMEFPKEDNDTVMLSTLQAQFPHAIGLKYRGPSGAWRAIRAVDNVLDPPKSGWGEDVFYITVAEGTKRKGGQVAESSERSKVVKRDPVNPLLKDLAVIGLSFETTEEELKEYLENKYGDLSLCEVKKDRETGKSRGFGFIRFKDEEAAKSALDADHYLGGRSFQVRQGKQKPMKLFIGRVGSGTTKDDLNDYFSQFGELTDVYLPTPFRNFAFITMASTEEARKMMMQSHEINGAALNVMERNPDTKGEGGPGGRGDDRGSDRRGGASYDRGVSSYDRGTSYNSSSNNYSSSRGGSLSNNLSNNDSYSSNRRSSYSQPQQLPQQTNSNDMAADLKTMLYTFLTNAK